MILEYRDLVEVNNIYDLAEDLIQGIYGTIIGGNEEDGYQVKLALGTSIKVKEVDRLRFLGKPRKDKFIVQVNDFVQIGDVAVVGVNGKIGIVLNVTKDLADNYWATVQYRENETYTQKTVIVGVQYLTPYDVTDKESNVELAKINASTDTSKHYAHSIQPIEYIQQVMKDLPVNPFEGACIKDIIKYCSRYGLKDNKQKEAKKILDYALWLYMESQNMTINPRIHNHEEIYKDLFRPQEQPV